MPLVFVHGVSNRKSPEYDAAELARNELFREHCLSALRGDPATVEVFNPYWGGEAAQFAWNQAFVTDPNDKLQAFGPAGDEMFDSALWAADVSPTPQKRNDLIVELAKRDFSAAVDLLWAAAGMTDRLTADHARELAAWSVPVAKYVEAQKDVKPPWLAGVTSDTVFAERLLDEVEKWGKSQPDPVRVPTAKAQSFGISDVLDRLKKGAKKSADRAADVAFGKFIEGKLPDLVRRFSLFIGDVLMYVSQRTTGSSKIADIVLGDLRKAGAIQRDKKEPLVCIGHSLGGVILYDLLSDPKLTDVPQCDLLMTIGSQVAYFEELKLLASSDRNFPADKKERVPASHHPRIKKWRNAFDRSDPLGYAAGRVFEAAQDFGFDTKVSALSAHGAYFLQPHFHERLLAQVAAGLL